MPIESYVDEQRELVVARVHGEFTFEEIVEAIKRSVHDPAFRKGFGVLSDHSDVGEPLTPVQARLMVDLLASVSKLMAGSRWAVVASKPASYGMLRMVAVLAEQVPMEVRVFRRREDAEEWLGFEAGGS